ncbi:HemK2/MTQ2 family protein methyltransferase [Nonomuraea sp. bgisy101]|uniref:HemK2/MTQ2 family protein methyltransferase n=1 Tax=Nonomuraea sp. bgisy101 TaxID=3413784 RepID=UPI003D762AB8
MYRPQGDTSMLAEAVAKIGVRPGSRVLDLGTGTGVIAMTVARTAAASVTAVDISWRAVVAVRLNALIHGLRDIRVLRGNLFAPVEGELFDVILVNPPYVPGKAAYPGRHRRNRAWDAGMDGRRLLDQICAHAPEHLSPGGTLLFVQSALCGVDASLRYLRNSGLNPRVVHRRPESFGPVMRARAVLLEAHGLISPGQRHEELVVIRADRTEAAAGLRAV